MLRGVFHASLSGEATMMLIEQTAVPQSALPIQAFRDHLRLGTGFADDGAQDGLIETLLRASLATVERRIAKALMARDFLLIVEGWTGCEAQKLPMAPVSALVSVTVKDRDGMAVAMPLVTFRLRPDTHAPRIETATGGLPSIPSGGTAEVVFTAGFGPAWADVPPDLAQAVLLLAAHYHENRHAEEDGGQPIPFGILALIEKWRAIRFGGSRA
jgi:uncharacterized phiE125 gp8 family phage protein